MSEFFAALQTTGTIRTAAILACAAGGAVLVLFHLLGKAVESRRSKRWRWDATEAELDAFAEALRGEVIDVNGVPIVIGRSPILDDGYRPAKPGDTPGSAEMDDAPAVDPDLDWPTRAGQFAETVTAAWQRIERRYGPRHAKAAPDPRTSVAALIEFTQEFSAIAERETGVPLAIHGPRESEIARPRRLVWLGEGDWTQTELPLEGVR